MTDDSERALDAGRAIRAYLGDLLAADEARALEDALVPALMGEDADAVLALITRDQATAAWTLAFIRDGEPPGGSTRGPGYAPLAGHGSVIAAPRFRCPQGDFLWYRRRASVRVPLCPTHGVPLAPDPRGAP